MCNNVYPCGHVLKYIYIHCLNECTCKCFVKPGKTELDGHFGRCVILLRLLINRGSEFDCVDASGLVQALDSLHLTGVLNRQLFLDRGIHFTLSAQSFTDIGSMAHRYVKGVIYVYIYLYI
jgi:hypothetical protein